LLDAQITLLDKQLRSIYAARPAGGFAYRAFDDATPDLESWLQTLELMNMYDRWFSKEELQQLPFAVQKDALAAIWSGLVAEAKALLEQAPGYGRGRWIWRRAGWSAWSRIRRASRSF
jgi:hypothetical protein